MAVTDAAGLEPVNGVVPQQPTTNVHSDNAAQQASPQRSYLESAIHSVVGMCWHDENSPLRNTIEGDAAQFLATVPMFITEGRGYALSAVLNGMNQAKPGDTTAHQIEDLGLGAVRGVASKGAIDLIGSRNWSFAAKGVGIGVSLRTLNSGLSRDTYYNNGQLDIAGGLLNRTLGSAFNPASMVIDAATFGIARYGLGFANSAKIALSADDMGLRFGPIASNMITGTAAGFASGAMGEANRQSSDMTHDYDWGKILASGANSAIVMGLAGGVGTRLSPTYPMYGAVENLGPESRYRFAVHPPGEGIDYSVLSDVQAQPNRAVDENIRLTPQPGRTSAPGDSELNELIYPSRASDWLASSPDARVAMADAVRFGANWLSANPDAQPEFYNGREDLIAGNDDARRMADYMHGPGGLRLNAMIHPGAFDIAMPLVSEVTGRQLVVQPPEGAIVNGNTSQWELGNSVSRGLRYLSANPEARPQFTQVGPHTFMPRNADADELEYNMALDKYNELGSGHYALRSLMDLAPDRIANNVQEPPTDRSVHYPPSRAVSEGLSWLSAHPDAQPQFTMVDGKYVPANQDAESLDEVMLGDFYFSRFGIDQINLDTLMRRTYRVSLTDPRPADSTEQRTTTDTTAPAVASSLRLGPTEVSIASGDITHSNSDAIITGVNSFGDWNGGVDHAIERAGGEHFYDQLRRQTNLTDGQVVIAQGDGQGPIKNVVFAVDDLQQPLGNVVQRALQAAENAGFQSVSIPAMRMGTFSGRFEPTDEAAVDQMVRGVQEFTNGNPHSVKNINFVVYNSPEIQALLQERMAQLGSPQPSA